MGRTVLAVAACLVGLMPGEAMGADASVGVDVNSAYVWRGLTLNDGAVVQPWIEVGLPHGFGVTVWSNVDVGEYDDAREGGEISEVDFILSYGREVGPVELGVSYIEYLCPHQAGEDGGAQAGTREVGADAAAALVGGLSARAMLYYDGDEVKGTYAAMGLTYGFDATEVFNLELDACAGYAGEGWAVGNSGGTEGGLHEYTLSLRATYILTETFEVGAHASHTGSLNEDVLPEQDTATYGGASVCYSF